MLVTFRAAAEHAELGGGAGSRGDGVAAPVNTAPPLPCLPSSARSSKVRSCGNGHELLLQLPKLLLLLQLLQLLLPKLKTPPSDGVYSPLVM